MTTKGGVVVVVLAVLWAVLFACVLHRALDRKSGALPQAAPPAKNG